jgi:hypothetical protein
MNIYSNVVGTELYIDETMRGYAPLTISIVHDQKYIVRAHAPGYVDQTLPMSSDTFEVVFTLEPAAALPWYLQMLKCIGKIIGGK